MTKNVAAYIERIKSLVRRRKLSEAKALAKLRGKRLAVARRKASAARNYDLISKAMRRFS